MRWNNVKMEIFITCQENKYISLAHSYSEKK